MAEGRQSRHHKGLRRALWPVLILSAAFFAFSAVRFFRDLTEIISILLQILVWATPIMWNIENITWY